MTWLALVVLAGAGQFIANGRLTGVATTTDTCVATTGTLRTVGSGKTYATPALCSTAATAGDTCKISAGTYSGWTQGTSGSSGRPITYCPALGETVTITSQISLASRSYVTIRGLALTGSAACDGGGYAAVVCMNNSSTHNTIDGNTVSLTTAVVAKIKDSAGSAGADNVFSSNTITKTGVDPSRPGPMFYVFGDRNRFDYNVMSGGGGDCFELGGSNVVVRGNSCDSLDGSLGTLLEHIDFVQVVGSTDPTLQFSLIENNTERNCINDSTNCHFVQVRSSLTVAADTLIIRGNYAYNLDSGGVGLQTTESGSPRGHVYHNTFAEFGGTDLNGTTLSPCDNACKALNNIVYKAGRSDGSPIATTGGSTQNSNLYYDPTNTSAAWGAPATAEATFATLKNKNPQFTNYPTACTLDPASPAAGTAVALTTVTSVTGSGSSVVVGDARFFQDGWAGANADWIRVGTSTTAQISSINYSTSTLTLTSGISWTNGDSVWLYKDSSGTVKITGSTPNIGACQ